MIKAFTDKESIFKVSRGRTEAAQKPNQRVFCVFLFMANNNFILSSRRNRMEENSSRLSRREAKGPTRKCRFAIDEGEDLVECSGKYCRSCTAGVIADCVALCCCPCALLNLLTLALVKVPWKMGRRCLGLGKKKRKCKKICNCCSNSNNGGDGHNQIGDGNLRERMRVEQEMWEFSIGFAEEDQEGGEEMGNFSARFEAERVWLELYQVGHLGFGRVSFTGI